MTDTDIEKRKFSRVSFVTQVKLSQKDQLWLGHVVDISFKGILVNSATPFSFDDGQPVIAEISFENGSSMRIKSMVAHNNDEYYGFRFMEYDLDAMARLRNIMLHNFGDEAACERELALLVDQQMLEQQNHTKE